LSFLKKKPYRGEKRFWEKRAHVQKKTTKKKTIILGEGIYCPLFIVIFSIFKLVFPGFFPGNEKKFLPFILRNKNST